MKRRIDPWLAAAVALYAANIIGWAVWALRRALEAERRAKPHHEVVSA